MKNGHKIFLKVLAVIAFVIVSCFIGYAVSEALACKHESTYNVITKEASCTEDGSEDIFCEECDEFLRTEVIPAEGHVWSEYELFKNPSVSKNGIEVRTCEKCGEQEFREFECQHEKTRTYVLKSPNCSSFGDEAVVCEYCNTVVQINDIDPLPHVETKVVVTKPATCQETGLEDVVCVECGDVVEQHEIPLGDHSYGSWKITKKATPSTEGVRTRTCSVCGKTVSENYKLSLGTNYIYIEGTNVAGNLTIASMSQAAINAYDMVYDVNLYGHSGSWVLGHNTRTLGALPQTQIGSLIYLSIGGSVRTYQVFISEEARQNEDETDIIGLKTDTSIYDYSDDDTLHMYTCYGKNGHRWMVIARQV